MVNDGPFYPKIDNKAEYTWVHESSVIDKSLQHAPGFFYSISSICSALKGTADKSMSCWTVRRSSLICFFCSIPVCCMFTFSQNYSCQPLNSLVVLSSHFSVSHFSHTLINLTKNTPNFYMLHEHCYAMRTSSALRLFFAKALCRCSVFTESYDSAQQHQIGLLFDHNLIYKLSFWSVTLKNVI